MQEKHVIVCSVDSGHFILNIQYSRFELKVPILSELAIKE